MFLLVMVIGPILGCFVVAQNTITTSDYKKGADVVIDQIINNIKIAVANNYNPATLTKSDYYPNPYNPNPQNTNFTGYFPTVEATPDDQPPVGFQAPDIANGYFVHINVKWQINGKAYSSLDRYTYIAGGD